MYPGEESFAKTRTGTYLFGPGGRIVFMPHATGKPAVNAAPAAFDASHQAILRRQLGLKQTAVILAAPDPQVRVKEALLRRAAKINRQLTSTKAPKARGTRRSAASIQDPVAAHSTQWKAVALSRAIPKDTQTALLQALTQARLLFRSDGDFVTHQLQQSPLKGEFLRTVKYVDVEVAAGPVTGGTGLGAESTQVIHVRLYTDGIHLGAQGQAEQLFGADRILDMRSGLMGYRRRSGSKTVEYFEGVSKHRYRTEHGRELFESERLKSVPPER